jgi:hypothetical protein
MGEGSVDHIYSIAGLIVNELKNFQEWETDSKKDMRKDMFLQETEKDPLTRRKRGLHVG